jgi:hypothetical protein
MNDPRKKNPTFGVGVFIVVVVLVVIGTLFFNAIRDKRQYDESMQGQSGSASASAGASQASSPAQ